MKIHVKAEDRNLCISLPTGLIFSRFALRTAFRCIRINGERIPGLTAEGADALSREIKHVKQKYGTWTLVEVQSADGEQISITL